MWARGLSGLQKYLHSQREKKKNHNLVALPSLFITVCMVASVRTFLLYLFHLVNLSSRLQGGLRDAAECSDAVRIHGRHQGERLHAQRVRAVVCEQGDGGLLGRNQAGRQVGCFCVTGFYSISAGLGNSWKSFISQQRLTGTGHQRLLWSWSIIWEKKTPRTINTQGSMHTNLTMHHYSRVMGRKHSSVKHYASTSTF